MKQFIINSKKMNNTHADDPANPEYHRNIINLLKTDFNLPISGGTGKSIDDPIVIKLTKENDIVGIEYEILKWLGILNGNSWEVIEQRLNFRNSKKIDQLKVEIIQNNSGQKMISEYFFDITSCFNKLESDVANYLREKGNNLTNNK